MAVYTQLTGNEVAYFLQNFGDYSLQKLQATDAGIENTNYFVSAQEPGSEPRSLVLTLFENLSSDHLPYFVALTTYLAEQGLPVPCPLRDRQNKAVHQLKNKPSLLVPRLPGQHPRTPNTAQCQAIALAMAKMHRCSTGLTLERQSDCGPDWRKQATEQLKPQLPEDQFKLLQTLVAQWQTDQADLACLPSGITHGDLFHDNALFIGNQLTGIIDFYNACQDLFIFDLAILVNNWCSLPDYQLDAERYQAVMSGYQSIRPLTPAEKNYWPRMLTYGALRFWISRLLCWNDQQRHQKVMQKDPNEMRHLLLSRLTQQPPPLD